MVTLRLHGVLIVLFKEHVHKYDGSEAKRSGSYDKDPSNIKVLATETVLKEPPLINAYNGCGCTTTSTLAVVLIEKSCLNLVVSWKVYLVTLPSVFNEKAPGAKFKTRPLGILGTVTGPVNCVHTYSTKSRVSPDKQVADDVANPCREKTPELEIVCEDGPLIDATGKKIGDLYTVVSTLELIMTPFDT
jgi:hypothetical protein